MAVRWFERFVFRQATGIRSAGKKVEAVEDVQLPPRKAVAARERRAPGGHAAVRRGSESRDRLRAIAQ